MTRFGKTKPICRSRSPTFRCDLLKTETDPENREKFTSVIESQTEKMNWLIITLLKISKLDAGTAEFREEPVHIASVLEKALAPFLITADLRNIQIVQRGVKDFVLQPFDEVYVRRSPGYRTQQNVRVEGEVLYPGVYAKETTNERISDLIRRAGGITSQAYVKGARLIRRMNADELARVQSVLKVSENTLRDSTLDSLDIIEPTYLVGIDLAAALDNPGGESDLVLREGDVIHVSNYINTVKISGEVMFPNAVTYEKKLKLKDYIANAGGFGMKAKKRKVFVVYQNGTVATRKGGRMPKIEPGCEIIVPRKPERRNRLGLPEIMSLTSSTTSIAAMITSILNSTK